MHDGILFQTVKNSDGEFASERQKKLKNKENLIRADVFSFEKMKIFLIKSSSSESKNIRRRWRIEFSFKLTKIEIANWGVNGKKMWKRRKISLVGRVCGFTKWIFFLKKIRPQSGRREGGDAELNCLWNCHRFISRICG